MKKTLLFMMPLLALLLSACSDQDAAPSTVDTKAWTLDAQMDTSYTPGNDFYMYCNGTWYKNAQLGDKSSIGTFDDATDLTRVRFQNLGNAVVNKYYADVATFGQSSESALKAIDSNIELFSGDYASKEEAWKALAESMKMGYNSLFSLYVYPKNGKTMVIFNGVDTTEYNPTPSVANLKELGISESKAANLVKSLKAVNQKLAAFSKEPLSMAYLEKHPEENENIVPLKSISTRGTGYNMLDVISESLGISTDNVYVHKSMLSYYETIQNLKPDEIQSSIIDRIAQDGVFYSQEFIDTYNLIHGTKMTFANFAWSFFLRNLAYIASHAYASKYITPENKARATAVCEEMRASFKERIENLTWMSSSTKAYAQKKLAGMKFNVGYPDDWIQEGLTDQLTGSSLVEDVIQLQKLSFNLRYNMIGKNAQDVSFSWLIIQPDSHLLITNAKYLFLFNSMNIYPAFLLKPFYDESASDAYNYAGFYSIGHEMTHGFDNNGAQYNALGDYENWWTVQDKMDFEARQQLLIDCYNHLSLSDGREELDKLYVDGTLTLGENIADLGGFNLVLQAYQEKLAKDGYTGDELVKQEKKFYQAFANVWRSKASIAYIQKTLTDEHAFDKCRVNGVVMNTDLWYELYNVKWGNNLYLRPEKRSYIW